MIERYGKERVRRGLLHFVLGKAVSAVAGLLAMLLVVRGLTVAEFAGYSVLIAFVEVFTAIAGLGLTHVVLRYVPELYATHRSVSLRRLIFITFTIRTVVLLVITFFVYSFSFYAARLVNLEDLLTAFELFLLVVVFRSSAHFLSQILESTLHQGISQLAFSLSAGARCLGMLWLAWSGLINLVNVIALEAVCDAFSCCVLGVGTVSVLRPIEVKAPSAYDTSWWGEQRLSVGRFAVIAYLQHLAVLPFGGNTNRLVGGAMFGEKVMAGFGFSQSLYEYFKRYLPTQLLIGMIRPIVVARFSISNNFRAAALLCDRALHVNLMLVFGAVAVLSVAGSEILLLLSGGKYGQESMMLLIAMLFLLCFESLRLVLEVLTQTVKHYDLMIPSNIFLSLSIIFAIVGYPLFGAFSFPAANMVALFFANAWVIYRLRHLGFEYRHDWRSTFNIIFVFVIAVLFGFFVKFLTVSWVLGSLATAVLYFLLFFLFVRESFFLLFKDLLGK